MKTENSPFKAELTYGIYFALISILINLVVWATAFIEKSGLFVSAAIAVVNLGILIVFLLLCTKYYRDHSLDGKITFGQAFMFALVIVIFSSVITGLYSFVFNKYIDPEYLARIMKSVQEKTYQFMANQGMSDEQIEAAMVKVEAQPIPTAFDALKSALISGLIGGAIMAVISAAIVKKNVQKDGFDQAMSELKSEE